MSMLVTISTPDLDVSVGFWAEILGSFTLFSIPGQLVHLYRWVFQGILLVPAPQAPAPADGPPMSVSSSCVLSQIDEIAMAREQRRLSSVTNPCVTSWSSREVGAAIPEGVRVTLTAARPPDPNSAQAEGLRHTGIGVPETQLQPLCAFVRRGHSTPPGTLCRRRVSSARAGTEIPFLYAQVVPVRKRRHPDARSVPIGVPG